MREFRRRYEEYCLEQGLDAVSQRDDIVRSLVVWYDTKVNSETVCRMKGVKWKGADDSNGNPKGEGGNQKRESSSEVDKLLAQGLDVIPVSPFTPDAERMSSGSIRSNDFFDRDVNPGNDSEKAFAYSNSLEEFLMANLEVTQDFQHDWVDVKTRHKPNGHVVIGMRERYHTWCKEKGKPVVENREMDPTNLKGTGALFALANELQFQEITVQRIAYAQFMEDRAQQMSKQFVIRAAYLTGEGMGRWDGSGVREC